MMMRENKKIAFNILFYMVMSFSLLHAQNASLSIENLNEQLGTFEINYDSPESIYGFQLNISGITIIEATNSLFDVNFNADDGIILGYELSGLFLPEGQGTLVSVMYQMDFDSTNICIDESILTNEMSNQIESDNGDCHSAQGINSVTISFGEIDTLNRIIDVMYVSPVDIQGFQFNVSGGTIIDVNNDSDLSIEFDPTTGGVLGIIMSSDDNPMEMGYGLLLKLQFSDQDEMLSCIHDPIIVSNYDEIEHAFENGENCLSMPAAYYGCDGTPLGELEYDYCGICGGDGVDEGECDCYGNIPDCFGECGGNAIVDECGVCGGDGMSCFIVGDLNFDGGINVSDIVLLVNLILPGSDEPTDEVAMAADVNGDGGINVLDVVALVQFIIPEESAREKNATKIIFNYGNGIFKYMADGKVSGIQLEVFGDYYINHDYLPAGWLLHEGNGMILLYGLDGSNLAGDVIFEYLGELYLKSAIVSDGIGNSISVDAYTVPENHALLPAFPNPFNPRTTLNYTVFESGIVVISVYDMRGNKVASLLNEERNLGNHSLIWNAEDFSSGMYLIKMFSNGFESNQKVVLLK